MHVEIPLNHSLRPLFAFSICQRIFVIFQTYNSPLTRFEEVYVSLNIYPETINSDSEGDL